MVTGLGHREFRVLLNEDLIMHQTSVFLYFDKSLLRFVLCDDDSVVQNLLDAISHVAIDTVSRSSNSVNGSGLKTR